MVDKEPIKTAFIGTLSVGKTTLFEELQVRLGGQQGVIFLTEVARRFFSDNPAVIRTSTETQGKIQQQIWNLEKAAYNSNPNIIICDRSVVDPPVYAHHFGDQLGARMLIDRARGWLPTYRRLFLLDPTGVPYKVDGLRDEDMDTREKIHETFLYYLGREKIPYQLLTGTLEERIARVMQELSI
jgi:nicotinamide riboside kinase